MSAEPCLIYDDPRDIEAVFLNDPHGSGWSVGPTTSRIVAYREHGLSDFTPYLAIYSGDEIIARVPAHMVTIHYARQTLTGEGQ